MLLTHSALYVIEATALLHTDGTQGNHYHLRCDHGCQSQRLRSPLTEANCIFIRSKLLTFPIPVVYSLVPTWVWGTNIKLNFVFNIEKLFNNMWTHHHQLVAGVLGS